MIHMCSFISISYVCTHILLLSFKSEENLETKMEWESNEEKKTQENKRSTQ